MDVQKSKLNKKDSSKLKNIDNFFVKGQKYLWHKKEFDEDIVRTISFDHNLSLPISRVLYAKGFVCKDEINSFLFSTLDKDTFDSSFLKDSSIAVNRLKEAIDKKERILYLLKPNLFR